MKIKKQKLQKDCHKKNVKSKNYKNCSEAPQIKNKINHLEKK